MIHLSDGVLGGGLPRLLWTLLPAVRSHSSSPPSTVWSPYGRGSAALVTKDSRNAVRSVSAPSLLKVFCSRIQSFVLAVQSLRSCVLLQSQIEFNAVPCSLSGARVHYYVLRRSPHMPLAGPPPDNKYGTYSPNYWPQTKSSGQAAVQRPCEPRGASKVRR